MVKYRHYFIFLLVFILYMPVFLIAESDPYDTTNIEQKVIEAKKKSGTLKPNYRKYVQGLFSNAFDLLQKGEFESARLGFERGLEKDPANSDAHYYLAETLSRMQLKNEALYHYNMSIALAPNSMNSPKAELAIKKLNTPDTTDPSITTKQTHEKNQPMLEIGKSCSFTLQYKDKGSGGKLDISIFDPRLENGFMSIGSYAQGNYDKPNGCITVVKPLVDKLPNGKLPLEHPAGYKLVWDDKKSGADMDGSVWHPSPPNNDYVCIGSIGQTGYNQPEIPGYACVHKCLVKSATKPSSIIWTDEGTGAKSKVTIYQLPVSGVIYAIPERNSNVSAPDLDPAGMCQ